MNSKTIFVSAGEVSGDIHAAALIKKMKELDPTLSFEGLGGPNMISAGMKSILKADFSTMSTMGFMEAMRFFRKKSSILKSSLKYIRDKEIKHLLLVDNQGFNIPLAKKAFKSGVKSIYYFPPHVSIWAKWNARIVARYVDLIIAPFYQDYLIYKEKVPAGSAVFPGHPLLDITSEPFTAKGLYEKYKLDKNKKIVSIMPGSRFQEIETLTGPMLQAAKILIEKHGVSVILPVSHKEFEKTILEKINFYGLENSIIIIRNDSYNAMRMADVNILASGTASLESALFRKPPVICYKISPVSFLIGKLLIQVKMIGLPNILLGKKYFPELLQKDCSADNIVKETLSLLHPDAEKKKEMAGYFDDIRKSLGEENVIERVARLLTERISDA
jgi:lipid-A-disaccharide synthase